jgi:hypothetical protein
MNSGRLGCGGVVARGVLIAMMGVVVLICIANRSWFEARAMNALYQHRPEIHVGGQFKPGASAVEDGVRQTAVMVGTVPSVRVSAPTAAWKRHHPDAVCADGSCTARATAKKFAGAAGVGLTTVLAGLLVCYVVWVLLAGDERDRFPWR